MKPLVRFPSRIMLDLSEAVRNGLETIAEMGGHESEVELVQMVLSKGIVLTLATARDLASSASNVRWPAAPSVMYKRKRRELELASDQASLNAPGGAATHKSPELEHVPAMIPASIRARIDQYVSQRSVDEEQAIVTLLGLGLDQAEQQRRAQPVSPEEKKANQMIQLAEKLYVRAIRRCSE